MTRAVAALAAAFLCAASAWALDARGLLEALRQGDESSRWAARRALVTAGPEVIEGLLAIAGGEDAALAGAARGALRGIVRAWSKTATRRAMISAPLLATAWSDDGAGVRSLALELLGLTSDAGVVPEIAALLHDREVAPAACLALEAIPGTDSVAALTVALEWADAPLRVLLLRSLASRPDRRATPDVARCLTDPDPAVRATAAEALRHIRESAAAPKHGRKP